MWMLNKSIIVEDYVLFTFFVFIPVGNFDFILRVHMDFFCNEKRAKRVNFCAEICMNCLVQMQINKIFVRKHVQP